MSESSPTVSLRPATPADADALTPMVVELLAIEGQVAGDGLGDTLGTLLASPDVGRAFLVEAGGELVGYAIVTYGYDLQFGGREAFLTDFFLQPEWRGRGIGKAALALVESEARQRGLAALHLTVNAENTGALRIYQHAGFTQWNRVVVTKRFVD